MFMWAAAVEAHGIYNIAGTRVCLRTDVFTLTIKAFIPVVSVHVHMGSSPAQLWKHTAFKTLPVQVFAYGLLCLQ